MFQLWTTLVHIETGKPGASQITEGPKLRPLRGKPLERRSFLIDL